MKKFFITLILCAVSIIGFGQNPYFVSQNEAESILLTYLRKSMNDTSTLGSLSMYIIDSLSFSECEPYSVGDTATLFYSWKDVTVAYVYFDYGEGGAATGSHHTTCTIRGVFVAADKRMKPVYIIPQVPYVGFPLSLYDDFYSQQLWWCKSVYEAYYYKLNILGRIEEDSAWSDVEVFEAVVWDDVWNTIKEPVYFDTLYVDTLYIDIHDTTYITIHDTVYIYLDSLGNEVDGWICKSIEIYPNPTNDIITVEGAENVSMTIYNELGQAILNRRIDSEFETFNISDFKPGIYFVKFGNKIIKLIKE